MTDSVVVEGYVKFRDGKKWKTRWVVLRKPSPVADCLVLLVFKDKSEKTQGHKERASITLEDICGLETGLWYEGPGFTLAILCLSQAAVLGFDSKEALLAWDIRVRYSLGEVHKFSVGVLPGTKLESGPATLHLCNNLLVLARDIPPTIIGQWNLPDLRRYGPVSNGFVFEGGTRCGYWAGVFFLSTAEGEHISFLFDCIVRGISPPGGHLVCSQCFQVNPNASQNYSEERVNHEAQELEKRLSMLSHQSSTASSTYGPSVAGDDRSISGSSDTSDTSQSDCSIGSRLVIWTDPAINPSSSESAGQLGAKVPQQSEEKLSINQVGEARPMAKPSRSRQLQEIGRQSSSDSGIATGSHSSYSGSFSSYAGSLDNGPGEDFESLLSLPPHLALDLSPCNCPPAPGHEYQVPTSLRYLYDTPKSLLQEQTGGSLALEPLIPLKVEETESEETPGIQSNFPGCSIAKLPQGQLEENKSKVAPSGDNPHPESCQICSSHTAGSKTLLIICSTCGGFKGTPLSCLGSSACPSIPEKRLCDVWAKPENHSLTPGSSEPNSAEESMSNWPFGRNSSALSKILVSTEPVASNASAAQPTNHSLVKMILKKVNEEQVTPSKRGKERLENLLTDLLGYPSTAGEAGTETGRLNVYESMAAASGRVLRSQPPVSHGSTSPDLSCDKDSIIYENCFKCKRESCHPPQRVPPIMTYCSTNSATLLVGQKNHPGCGQALPVKPCLETSVEHKEMSKQEDSAQVKQVDNVVQNRILKCEELNCQSETDEDKKTRSKEERRKVDPAYEIMESRALEKNTETEEKSKYELMGSCGHQRFLHETEGAMFVFPTDVTSSDRTRGDGVTYVNIPVSPTSKKQLNYMELELQEPALGGRGTASHLSTQRKSSSKYAQIDITATETAHKVGTQHALGREEGLHSMEQRRRGAPQ